jgi:uncharacterized protein (TIGR00251 family)
MIVNVKVTPKAKLSRIEKLSETSYKIHVTQAPEDNKANKAVLELLAEHLSVRKNQVVLIRGEKSRNKVVEVKL